jgi:hypothetical protein
MRYFKKMLVSFLQSNIVCDKSYILTEKTVVYLPQNYRDEEQISSFQALEIGLRALGKIVIDIYNRVMKPSTPYPLPGVANI